MHHAAVSFTLALQTLDILVGDNDEPLIVVNPAVTSLYDSTPSGGDYGWAVFSSLCREVSLIFMPQLLAGG
jgi:hypothetical protein